MDEKVIRVKFCLSQQRPSEKTQEALAGVGGRRWERGGQPHTGGSSEEEPDVNFNPSPAECWQTG